MHCRTTGYVETRTFIVFSVSVLLAWWSWTAQYALQGTSWHKPCPVMLWQGLGTQSRGLQLSRPRTSIAGLIIRQVRNLVPAVRLAGVEIIANYDQVTGVLYRCAVGVQYTFLPWYVSCERLRTAASFQYIVFSMLLERDHVFYIQ